MKILVLIGCLVTCATTAEAFGQPLPAARAKAIRTEVERAHRQEQEAFVNGDCEAMASFYARDVSFYANGRAVPSISGLVTLCERIPRPFAPSAGRSDSIHVLSETTAYLLRVMEFPPRDEAGARPQTEVVTKVWSKGPEGWKIVHFHSSMSPVPNE